MEVKKKHRDRQSDKEPMVFLFIDDADLCCNRCEEVLNVILRYFAHPNIVTFVAGDYEKFKEVLLINYLNNFKISQVITCTESTGENLAQDLLDSNKKLVNDNLKKMLPPSLRYELVTYRYNERFSFSYENRGLNKKHIF